MVLTLFWTVSDRFRTVSDRFRTVSDRLRTVSDQFFVPFRIILNGKKTEKQNGNENERKKTDKTNKKAEKNCENHFLLKPLKPKVTYKPLASPLSRHIY